MAEEPVVIGDPAPRTRKWPIVVGVVVVVLIAAGAGFWVWHEQPSFCAAICHTPMDEYLETYEQEAGTAGVDKWGNEVANTNAMLAVSHKAQGKDCMACHVPTLSEQMSEGMNWVTGNYVYPLEERDTEMLTEAHQPQHGEIECSECHKAHRASVMYCTQCHSEAEVPEGWLTVAEANKLSTAA